jgi:hypothetical protein
LILFLSEKIRNYCTYIRAYLDYLTNILHKSPEDVSWEELRDHIRWLQKYHKEKLYDWEVGI